MARRHNAHAAKEYCTARPREPHAGRRGVSPRFRTLVEAHDWKGRTAVDIGCGTGAGTLLLAKLGAFAIGVDIDPLALMEAGGRAEEDSADSARFVCADAELVDYRAIAKAPSGLEGVLAHLCFSDEIARRAAESLRPGGVFILRSFHEDMWKESGGPSHFAKSEAEMRGLLKSLGLDVVHLEVERRTQSFESFAAFAEDMLSDPARRARWEEDGRIATLQRAFSRGNRTLTEAFLVVEARKPAERKRATTTRKGTRKS